MVQTSLQRGDLTQASAIAHATINHQLSFNLYRLKHKGHRAGGVHGWRECTRRESTDSPRTQPNGDNTKRERTALKMFGTKGLFEQVPKTLPFQQTEAQRGIPEVGTTQATEALLKIFKGSAAGPGR